MRRKCLLIDGHSLVYRAFFAIPFLSTRDGQPTNALFGFSNMMLKLLSEEKPDFVFVAFDAPARTFRHEAFVDYKATRKPTPDELKSQVPLAKEAAASLGAVVLEAPGYEADDIVGTLARQAEACGDDVLIVTGDLDELQLVSDRIKVAATTRGVSEVTVYDRDAIAERFGLTPEQFVDYKALKGDTSDNIPGVPGVGDKTASKLIAQFGSIEAMLERLDELPPGKLRSSLEEGQEQILASRELCRIVTDVPLGISCATTPKMARPSGEAEALFRRYEFETLIRRLPPAEPTPEVESSAKTASAPAPESKMVRSDADLRSLLSPPDDGGWMAVSLHRLDGPLAGIGIAKDGGTGHYIPLRQEGSPQGDLLAGFEGRYEVPVASLRRFFEEPPAPLVTHDLKSAGLALEDAGLSPAALTDDTMLAGYLLQPGRGSYSLEWLVSRYLDFDVPEGTEPWERSATEAALVWRLNRALKADLENQGLEQVYSQIEVPLAPVLADMERAGIRVDVEYLQSFSETLTSEIARLESDICELAGEVFNIGSTRQLGRILFDKLQIPCGKRTKTGYSTDAETLEGLASTWDIAARVLQWREYTKLKGTYADALPALVDPADHRLHTSFNQTGAATGRLSSSDPNLQNIPIKTAMGREIRAAFVAPPGRQLISADYSQIELRLLAHLSEDPELVRCFAELEDIHSRTACALFGVGVEGVTEEMRRRAKTINFSVIYGKTDFGLSKELGIGVGEARDYINAYFEQYPRVREFTQEVLEKARTNGYVTTIFGRKRWFPEIHARDRNVRANAERAAFNAPLQGSAADLIKLAMIRLHELLGLLDVRMLLQVHDELVFEVGQDALEDAATVIRREMEGVCELKVPLVVDVKRGSNWRDMDRLAGASSGGGVQRKESVT